jgi:hypothetical protein
MSNEFDPYREALVMELVTHWPEDYDAWDAVTKRKIEESLHAKPQDAHELVYVRQHSGFSREITITPDDLARVGA